MLHGMHERCMMHWLLVCRGRQRMSRAQELQLGRKLGTL